ncbi:uncharacterized protein TrAtP1_005849 [Trichoderma atroviride]|uniref:uncharacterized protein n=1 Tax=Hypocrea atroviridis TaxID=63577 RepID=UPI00332E3869|nr:hypothetical protein TrAtP1_005849 [Trichoderma atroviride]
MSFRKRNTVIGIAGTTPEPQRAKISVSGTRPSPHDGRLTTSTGTSSLDQLLAGHAGLPMGTSLLIEESGTTDFGGILLRYFAAEGLVQGHHVHVLGFGDHWRRELPGLASESRSKDANSSKSSDSKMKIAWRYEALSSRATPSRGPSIADSAEGIAPFCHTFDLSARLEDSVAQGQFYTTRGGGMDPTQSPFRRFITDITSRLKSSPPTSIHKIVIPSLLSPTIYPPISLPATGDTAVPAPHPCLAAAVSFADCCHDDTSHLAIPPFDGPCSTSRASLRWCRGDDSASATDTPPR